MPLGNRQRPQPRLDQVILVVEHNGRRVAHEPPDIFQFGRGNRHHLPPFCVPCARRISAAATPVSGTISSASPASVTAPGIPQTTLESLSCATTWPPASRIHCAPRIPSCPMPVSTIPSVPAPQIFATLRNNTSTAGRQEFSGGS